MFQNVKNQITALNWNHEQTTNFYRLDDVEDGSLLRRAKPATHAVFGIAQTVNSATYQLVEIIGRVQEIGEGKMVQIVIGKHCITFAVLSASRSVLYNADRRVSRSVDGLKSLMLGQSIDLFWTYNVSEPSAFEYLQMVDASKHRPCLRPQEFELTS